MTHKEIVDTIAEWFQIAKAGGLVLPDGWFGRPFDNLHRLTYLEARPHKLILELDNQLLLVFTDLQTAEIDKSELILSEFTHCTFDWQEFGSLLPHVVVYRSGIVKLVPPIGLTIS